DQSSSRDAEGSGVSGRIVGSMARCPPGAASVLQASVGPPGRGLPAIGAQLIGGRRRALAYKDLRDYLAALEIRGKLHHVKKEVDPDWEVAAFIRRVFQRVSPARPPAVMFERV